MQSRALRMYCTPFIRKCCPVTTTLDKPRSAANVRADILICWSGVAREDEADEEAAAATEDNDESDDDDDAAHVEMYTRFFSSSIGSSAFFQNSCAAARKMFHPSLVCAATYENRHAHR